MEVCGIIAEYNPFHNGHAHHMRRAKELTGAQRVIVVMSGHFVQRGEPAVWDKWVRAAHALRMGADMVIELPWGYAVNNAEYFACGGVGILDALGVVDYLCFGAEQADLAALAQGARLWQHETPQVAQLVRENLRLGMSHPRARAQALVSAGLPAQQLPNNTLAAMYLLWLERLHSAIKPVALPRAGEGHHSARMGYMASATAIRADMLAGADAWKSAVPDLVAAEARAPVFQRDFDQLLLHTLRNVPVWDSAGGLDRRIRKAARDSADYEQCLRDAKSKAYTMARIKRAALGALLGVTPAQQQLLTQQRPLYARVLGVRRESLGLLADVTRRSRIPVVTRFAHFTPQDEALGLLRGWDEQAGDLYALAQKDPRHRVCAREYTQPMLIVE
ncbi:MAG: nucleotidyltransferase family protein [Eubacteriales bacterium]|nr:nucleotidyltransferase family protein [Eubacteriales bacterium]